MALKKYRYSDVTPQNLYTNRRNFIVASSAFSSSVVTSGFLLGEAVASNSALKPNSFDEITNYNNFYE